LSVSLTPSSWHGGWSPPPGQRTRPSEHLRKQLARPLAGAQYPGAGTGSGVSHWHRPPSDSGVTCSAITTTTRSHARTVRSACGRWNWFSSQEETQGGGLARARRLPDSYTALHSKAARVNQQPALKRLNPPTNTQIRWDAQSNRRMGPCPGQSPYSHCSWSCSGTSTDTAWPSATPSRLCAAFAPAHVSRLSAHATCCPSVALALKRTREGVAKAAGWAPLLDELTKQPHVVELHVVRGSHGGAHERGGVVLVPVPVLHHAPQATRPSVCTTLRSQPGRYDGSSF